MSNGLWFSIAISVLGGLGVFLLGMKYMSEGLQAVSGNRLRKIVGLITDNRIMGMLVGLTVTCIVQSSSVTTVMVIGLVNSAVMTLTQAIGVIFGANIGTTITGWILTLNIGKYGLPLLGISALVFIFAKPGKIRYAGMVFMGIGMIFFGLQLMSEGFKPLHTIPELKEWFIAFQAASYLGVLKCALVGCLITMVIQSSSATLGITMGLASTGMINFQTAGALVLGENIGTTITAFLASLGATPNAKRAAYAHILFNLIGVLWITLITIPIYFPLVAKLIGHDPNTMVVLANGEESFPYILVGIAMVHTGFNVVNTLVFLPFTGVLAKLVTWLVPDKKSTAPFTLPPLEIVRGDTPALGVLQSEKYILFMADSDEIMLETLGAVLESDKITGEDKAKIFEREKLLDTMQEEIIVFLGELINGELSYDVQLTGRHQMRMADEYESISDYAAAVLKGLLKRHENKLDFAPMDIQEFIDINRRVLDYVKKVNLAVRTNNVRLAADLVLVSHEITRIMKQYRQAHLTRIVDNVSTPLSSLVYTDIWNSYRRLKDHALNIAEIVTDKK
ncbi:MAG: Na/Pi cotransporter family protein [Kiritimatiellales bacterium]